MFRGIALELRDHFPSAVWNGFWDAAFTGSSALLAILYGVALGNLLRGVPLDAHGYFAGTFAFLLNPYAVAVGLFALLVLAQHGEYSTRLVVPFFKRVIPELGWIYLPFAAFVLTAESNAVNLTDGLDGLAISVFAIAAAAYTALAYVVGNRVLADYLLLTHFSQAGELTVFCGSLVGSSLGFLWYNSYPAEIFMGDVGSLGLGAALGTVAILIKQEMLLVIVGGVFVLEALSVVIQVASFKLTGRRVFKMAPIHHHFELMGWSEPKVITRFVIIAVIFALFSLTTLKLR